MLPGFIVVGASRSGTTTLHQALSEHPSLFLPKKKELHFFNNTKNFNRGLGYYEKSFKQSKPHQVAGEISPPYFHKGITLDARLKYHWDVADDSAIRIRRSMPDTKLIFTLRNPVDRAFSQYVKNFSQGKDMASSFEEAVALELSGRRAPERDQSCWLYKSSYSQHIDHWLSLFPKEQTLFLVFEEWTKEPESAFAKVYDFLGVESKGVKHDHLQVANAARARKTRGVFRLLAPVRTSSLLGKLHRKLATTPSHGSSSPTPETRRKLNDYFKEDIDALEKMLDLPLDIWRCGETLA